MWTRAAGAVLLFFALDSLAFRTGYYASILELDSAAGYLENTIWLEQRRAPAGSNEVLAVGDSRIPLKPDVASDAGAGYRFFTIAVPGTTPRCWYYMLREVDPGANRYAAIVIPFDTYDDRSWENLAARELDIRYLAPLAGFRDAIEFPLSYPGWPERGKAASTALFKGLVYREDFQDFLVRHKWRITLARDLKARRSGWRYNTEWDHANLEGLSVDWSARAVRLPAGIPQPKRQEIEELLLREQPSVSGDFAAYRRTWLGKILARYRGSRTRIVLVRLARGPVVRPGLASDLRSSIREFGERGEAALVDEHRFDSLERPELFADALHMNQKGAEEFSTMLARDVASILREARP